MTRILHFKAKNFKHIKEVEIFPGDDSMIVVGGQNAQGKTSVLDGIQATLGGKRLIDKMPLRVGEETGFSEVMLDGDGTVDPVAIIVRRHWENFGKKTWLTITTKDGYEAPSPQTILDRFFSAVTFDPLAFSKMDPSHQAKALKDLVGLDIDSLEEEEARLYDDRKRINKKGTDLKAQIAAMPHEYDDVDPDPRDAETILERLKEAAANNQAYEKASSFSKLMADAFEKDKKQLADLRTQLIKAEAIVEQTGKALQDAISDLGKCPLPVNTMDIISQLTDIERHNQRLQENKNRAFAELDLEDLRQESLKLSKEIKDIQHMRASALNDVKWPMDGLSVEGDQVMYNGVPLSQVSSSEALDIAVAIGIEMNPGLNVMFIKDGALIGDEKLSIIRQRAEDAGYQIWVEDVCRNKKDTERCTVIIEDGLVVNGNG